MSRKKTKLRTFKCDGEEPYCDGAPCTLRTETVVLPHFCPFFEDFVGSWYEPKPKIKDVVKNTV